MSERACGRRGRSFGRDRKGSILAILGVALPVLVMLAFGTVEYGTLLHRRATLQTAVDEGVLAAGNMLKLANTLDPVVIAAATHVIAQRAATPPDRSATISVRVLDRRTSVEAQVEETVPSLMGRLMNLPTNTIVVQAKSQLVGALRLCLLALDDQTRDAFLLQKSAQVTATTCSLYSNSRHASGLAGRHDATARAASICSAGGFDGSKASFQPSPVTGCPSLGDPLKDRAPPRAETCISVPAWLNPKGQAGNTVTESGSLDPGTYCGGLTVTDTAVVTLRPGIYVIKDGPLLVTKSASISGQGVGFYFMGNRGGMLLGKKTTISLTAPVSGPMAGLLMMEERTVVDPRPLAVDLTEALPPPPAPVEAPPMREYRIISDNARTMLGTIYLPAGRLIIDSSKPVADQSAYTVIVARMIHLYEGPNLVLNADYAGTSVPVPPGVGPRTGTIALAR